MKIILVLLLCLSLFGSGEEPEQNKFLKSCAQFDQIYIPTLMFTKLNKQRESEIAINKLKNKWQSFSEQYQELEIKYGVDITDELWQIDFEKISDQIIAADILIRQSSLEAAYLELDGVREVFTELRSRNGMDYFLDKMTDFYDLMDEMSAITANTTSLSRQEKQRLTLLNDEALKQWQEISQANLNGKYFGFSKAKIKAIKKRIKLEKGSLVNLETALAVSGTRRIIKATNDCQTNFIMLYKAFGDFQPILDSAKQERLKKENEEKNSKLDKKAS